MAADRGQWFRAFAEMMRWLEQVELKHAELLRTIRYFDKLSSVWLALGSPKLHPIAVSSEAIHPGARAFARRQCSMFADMRDVAKAHWKRSADSRVRDQPECEGFSESFGDKIAAMRAEEVK
jgi:hypothetical protein